MAVTNQRGLTPLRRERLAPFVLGVLVTIACWLLWSRGLFRLPIRNADSYLAAVVTLGGVMAGFMATLKTLLYSMDARTFGRLQKSGYLRDMLRYISEAIWGSLLMCVVALVGFFAPASTPLHLALIGITVFALACVARITRIAGSLLMLRQGHG